MDKISRIFLIVVDSMGCGYQEDSGKYGDIGACTLDTIRKSDEWNCPNLESMGIFGIDGFKKGERYYLEGKDAPDADAAACPGFAEAHGVPGKEMSGTCSGLEDMRCASGSGCELKEASGVAGTNHGFAGAFGRLREQSMGKDTTAGHWEIAGLVTDYAFPTFPEGFPDEIIKAFEKETGRRVLCNKPYSGTEVIKDYGKEHMENGGLIVYTSADSVFQIAAHEDIVPLDELYKYCRIARRILAGDRYGAARVIARPFTGSLEGGFVRDNAARHDFSIQPPRPTMLDILETHGLASIGIGKIRDIFAGRGLDERFTTPSVSNEDGMDKTIALMDEDFKGICFVNLVETDSVYGHRRDIAGYASAVSAFDFRLGEMMAKLRPDDIIMVTADHGCDPGFKGTDHTREFIPFVAYGQRVKAGADIGTRDCFGDIAATILDIFGLSGRTVSGMADNDEPGSIIDGKSFAELILKQSY